MTGQHPVIATLERAHSQGQVSRAAFVRTLAAATALGVFGGSSALALAAAERRADHLEATASPRHGGTLNVALTGQPDHFDPATASIYTSACRSTPSC